MIKIRGRMIFLIIALLAVTAGLPGQSVADDTVAIRNNRIIAAVHARGGLIFATPPYWGRENTEKGFIAFVAYIGESVSREVVLVILKDYEMLKKRTAAGDIDIGFYGPTLYIEAKEAWPQLKYIATVILKETGRPYYYSYLISKTGTNLSNIESLRDKSFAFGSRESTSGYMYPRAWMEENGLNPCEYFSTVVFLGSHARVIDAIVQGEIDAGVVSPTPMIQAENERGVQFNRIRKFGPIPNSLLAVNPGISDETITDVISALSDLPPAVTDVREFAFSGFTVLSDDAYDQMRRVLQITKECESY